MNQLQNVIIVYNNEALSSYLWMNNGRKWHLFPFMEGRDLYPCLTKKFAIDSLTFDSLQTELRGDGFDIDIKAIHGL